MSQRPESIECSAETAHTFVPNKEQHLLHPLSGPDQRVSGRWIFSEASRIVAGRTRAP